MYFKSALNTVFVVVVACLSRAVKAQLDPTNFACTALNSTSIRTTWDKATDTTVQGYFLDAIRSDGLVDEPFSSIELNDRTYEENVFHGLGEYGRYNLTIHSYTSSTNQTTYTVVCTTHEDVPDGAPMSLTCEGTGYFQIDCTWAAIDQEYLNGILLGYTVQWFKLNNSVITSNTTNTESMVITGLNYDTKYVILVNGFTSVGQSTVYTSDIAKTLDLYPQEEENKTKYYCYETVPGYVEFGWEEMPCTIYAGTIGALLMVITVFICIFCCQACCQRERPSNNLQLNMTTIKQTSDAPDSSDDDDDDDDGDNIDETPPNTQDDKEYDDTDSDQLSNADDERGSTAESKLSNDASDQKADVANGPRPAEMRRQIGNRVIGGDPRHGEESDGSEDSLYNTSDSDYDTFDEDDAAGGAIAPRLPQMKKTFTKTKSKTEEDATGGAIASRLHVIKKTQTKSKTETGNNEVNVVNVEDETEQKTDVSNGKTIIKSNTTGVGNTPSHSMKNKKKGSVKMDAVFSPISEKSPINDDESLDDWGDNRNDSKHGHIKKIYELDDWNDGVEDKSKDNKNRNRNGSSLGDIGKTYELGYWIDDEKIKSKDKNTLIKVSGTMGHIKSEDSGVTMGDWDEIDDEPEAGSESNIQADNPQGTFDDWDDIRTVVSKQTITSVGAKTKTSHKSTSKSQVRVAKSPVIDSDWDDVGTYSPNLPVQYTDWDVQIGTTEGKNTDIAQKSVKYKETATVSNHTNSATKVVLKNSSKSNKVLNTVTDTTATIEPREDINWNDIEENAGEYDSVFDKDVTRILNHSTVSNRNNNLERSNIAGNMPNTNGKSVVIKQSRSNPTLSKQVNTFPRTQSNSDIQNGNTKRPPRGQLVTDQIQVHAPPQVDQRTSKQNETKSAEHGYRKHENSMLKGPANINKQTDSARGNGISSTRKGSSNIKPATVNQASSIADHIEHVHLEDESDVKSAMDKRIMSPKTFAWDRRKSEDISLKSGRKTPVKTFQSFRFPVKEAEPPARGDRLGKKFPFLSPENDVSWSQPQFDKRNVKMNRWTGDQADETGHQYNVAGTQNTGRSVLDKFTFNKPRHAFSESDIEADSTKNQGPQVFYGFGVGKFRKFAAKWINRIRRKRPTPTVDSEWGK